MAGFLTVQQEKPGAKSDGARAGALSGGIAGALIIVGQVIGGIAALVYFQSSGAQVPFGQVPSLGEDPAISSVYYGTGMVTALCFGIVGAALAAGTGALAGYLTTNEQSEIITPPSPTE